MVPPVFISKRAKKRIDGYIWCRINDILEDAQDRKKAIMACLDVLEEMIDEDTKHK